MGEPIVANVRSASLGQKSADSIFFPGSTEKLAVTASADATAAIGCKIVRLYSTTDAYITVASVPVASSVDMPIVAKEEYYIGVPLNEKISVIRKSADGYLHITSVDVG